MDNGRSKRPSDQPHSAHATQPHGCAVMLSGTNASQSTAIQPCPSTRDHLHGTTRAGAHSSTRRVNRTAAIYSLSQIKPPPAPRTGRTGALPPPAATFSPPRLFPHNEKPPLVPSSSEEPWSLSVHPSTPPRRGPRGRGSVTSPAGAPSASSAQRCLFPAALPPLPAPAEREPSPGTAPLPASPPARHYQTRPGQAAALELL